jgi:aspartyl-tRNA(Asn)/glutamyl-tRNA(Gln) amidotransferase subunit A
MTLTDLSLAQAARMLRLGEISSMDLVTACLERIDRYDATQHAFLAVRADVALEEARQADRRLATARRGQETAPALLGVPLAVKDVLCVEGLPCTCGSKILEGFYPPFDATGVARLRAAGAIVMGKTNTDEFAMGSSTENSAYGATRNPWDAARVPGGSSGGSAAAVASRMVPAALGTDTGGSVRQPASFCGITGLKPSYGRVSRYGLVAYGSSLDCLGVLARTVEDTALVLGLMAGHDPLDSTTLDQPVPDYLQGLAGEPDLHGLRVGVPREYFIEGMQPEVEQAVRQAVRQMASLGADVREVSLPHTEYALPVYYLIAPAEASANLARYDGMRFGPREAAPDLWQTYATTRGDRFGAEVKRRIMLGTYALSAGYYDAYYGQAQKVRTLIRDDFDRAFREVDIITCPVAPTTAFRIGENTSDPLAMYLEDVFTLPANLAGIPGLALPCGFDSQGLPIGMQLNGPPLSEPQLLRAGWRYQQSTAWHLEAPAL